MVIKMKKIALILALLMVVMGILVSCGSDGGDGNDGGDTTGSQSGGGEELGTPPADTWENAQGQSGTVEYVYENDVLVKTIFKYGESNMVWRTVEHFITDDSGMTAWMENHFDSNGAKIFSLSMTKHPAEEGSTERFPDYIYGYDYTFEETSSDMNYTINGMSDRTKRSNTFTGAQDYWVTEYGADGLPEKTTVYYRDGVRKISWRFFTEDGKVAYAQSADDYMNFDYGESYALERDENGNVTFVPGYASINGDKVTSFSPRDVDDEVVAITVKYDSNGNVTEHTYPREYTTKSPIVETYTYEGDTRVKCVFTEVTSYENNTVGTFILNADSTLASADYTYLNGSIGGGDTTYYQYEYFDSGLVSKIKAYWSSEIEEDENYPDLEWEKEFYESGKLKMECSYDSSDMDYREEYFDENGETIDYKRGTYIEDGTKTPDVDA